MGYGRGGRGVHGATTEGAVAGGDGGGAGRAGAAEQGEQRPGGPGAAGDGAAGGRRRRVVRGGGPTRGVAERGDGRRGGAAVQPARPGGGGDRAGARPAGDLRPGRAGADRRDGAAPPRPQGRRDGDVVAEHAGTAAAPRRVTESGRDDGPPGVGGRGQLVPEDADLVPDRHGRAQAQGRGRAGGRPPDRAKKGLIEQAYELAEAAGLALWCQDEAGPYQTVPYPGAGWSPGGEPARQPHEYVRTGTAKLLTLFRPATGEVRAMGVTSAPNAVLHPWLRAEVTQILA